MKQTAAPTNTSGKTSSQPFFGRLDGAVMESQAAEPTFFGPAPFVQAKLTIGAPDDPYEREADQVAEQVVRRMSAPTADKEQKDEPPTIQRLPLSVQRKCAACEEEEKVQKTEEPESMEEKIQRKPIFESGSDDENLAGLNPGDLPIQRKCAECEKEETEAVQRKPDGGGEMTASSSVASRLSSAKGGGSPLPDSVQTSMGDALGADLSGVRVHTDSQSVQLNRDLGAQAFTHGSDVYFGAGKFKPGTGDGDRLLAHELAHVGQQGKSIQKQAIEQPIGNDAATGEQARFIVEDLATPGDGQMRKSDFLRRLNQEVCQTANQAMQGTQFTADSCPYIRNAFAKHQNSTPAQIERLLARYEPALQTAQTFETYFQLFKGKVRQVVAAWLQNGDLSGVPGDIAEQIPVSVRMAAGAAHGLSSVAGAIGSGFSSMAAGLSNAVSGIGSLFFKAKPGGARVSQSPVTVMQSLGKGSNLEGGTRGKMESAFGSGFSDVQVHTDSHAANLASNMNARAFTVGNHVAFGSGEYRPGTLAGDALMAHELAHVEQQKNASPDKINRPGEPDEQKSLNKKSGLRLQRCSFIEAPTNLTDAQAKAKWIEKAMGEDKSGTDSAIVDIFKSVKSSSEFIEIQEHLNMEKVFDYLTDWSAVQIGSLGPVDKGKQKLNEKRKSYIVDRVMELKMPLAEPFVHFVFNSMYTDDMDQVLILLSKDSRLGQTVGQMPEVKKIIAARGLKLEDYHESGGSFFRGMGQGLEDFLTSGELAQGGKALTLDTQTMDLPPEYQNIVHETRMAQIKEGFSNMGYGAFDYLTFGIPSGIYGLGKNTISGFSNLAQGNYETAGYELTGAAIVVVSAVTAKAYSVVSKPKTPAIQSGTLLGPEGPNQFVIQGYTGPIPKEVAKLGAALALSPEGQALGGLIISRIGEKGMLNVAKYIQADSKIAWFIGKNGMAALEAINEAKGDLALAQQIMSSKPAGLLPAAEQPAGLLPEVQKGTVTITDAAKSFAKKSKQETIKQAKLEKTADELAKRGYDVTVEGEGVAAGELVISRKGGGPVIQVESKSLEANSVSAVKGNITKGTKQAGDGGTILIDGTTAGVSEATFQKGFESFKRQSLPDRIKKNSPGKTGQIIFIFGESSVLNFEF